MLLIGVDLGGSNCRVGLFESAKPDLSDLKLISSSQRSINKQFEVGIDELSIQIKNLLSNKTTQIAAVGVSLPAIIADKNLGIMSDSVNLRGWDHHPIAPELSKRISLPVQCFHDVAAATIAEAKLGDGKGADKFVQLIWGTGFGGCKIEKLAAGWHLTSFEPGHYIADRRGKKCSCGQLGCPELNLGGGALKAQWGELSQISDHDPRWQSVVELATQVIATTVAFHPTSLIVFAGGLIEKRPFLLSAITQQLKEKLTVFPCPSLTVSQFRPSAGLYGAAILTQLELI